MHHIFFISSSVEGHLGCFQFLAIMKFNNEHGWTKISAVVGWSIFWVYAQEWYSWISRQMDSSLPWETVTDFHTAQICSHQQWMNVPLTQHLCQHEYNLSYWSDWYKVDSQVVLICISMMAKDVEHFFESFLAIWVYSWFSVVGVGSFFPCGLWGWNPGWWAWRKGSLPEMPSCWPHSSWNSQNFISLWTLKEIPVFIWQINFYTCTKICGFILLCCVVFLVFLLSNGVRWCLTGFSVLITFRIKLASRFNELYHI
jgi:hypothetical protein